MGQGLRPPAVVRGCSGSGPGERPQRSHRPLWLLVAKKRRLLWAQPLPRSGRCGRSARTTLGDERSRVPQQKDAVSAEQQDEVHLQHRGHAGRLAAALCPGESAEAARLRLSRAGQRVWGEPSGSARQGSVIAATMRDIFTSKQDIFGNYVFRPTRPPAASLSARSTRLMSSRSSIGTAIRRPHCWPSCAG